VAAGLRLRLQVKARWIALLAVSVVAGCGGSGDGNHREQAAKPPSAAKQAAIAEAQKRADAVALMLSGVAGLKDMRVIETVAQERAWWVAQKRAQRVSLKLSDFPASWRKGPLPQPGVPLASVRLAKCFGIDHAGHVPVAYWQSGEFLTDGTKVTSAVWAYATEAEAEAVFDRHWRGLRRILDKQWDANYRPGRVPAADCVTALFPDGGDYRVKVEVGDRSVFLGPCAEGCAAWAVTVRVRGKGSSATAFVDLHVHRHGNVVVEMRTRRARKPFDRELQNDLLRAVIERMRVSR
jgi:hypothetical protein